MAKNEKKINVKVEGKVWEEAKKTATDNIVKKADIKGFRKGKAPVAVVLKNVQEESINLDAADIVLQAEYVKVIKENKNLEIIAEPKIELKEISNEGVEFEFILTLKPEVKLGEYKGLKVKKETIKVDKKEIEDTIKNMQQKYKEERIKTGKLVDGDIAIIDFEGFKGKEAFEGGKGEDYSLEIGSNTFIPGFEEQLIGAKKGDSLEVNVTFPKDYHSEDLKGQKVVFKVTIKETKESHIPELGEDFYEDLGLEGVNSKETLESEVEKNIKVNKESEAENKYLDDLLESAAKNATVEIPEQLISEELNRMVKQYEQNLSMQGLSLEQFFQFTNSNEEALKEQMKEEAGKRVKYRLVLEAIAKAEKIKVTDAEVKKETKKLAEKYQMEEEEFLKSFGGTDMIKYDLEMRKSIEILKG